MQYMQRLACAGKHCVSSGSFLLVVQEVMGRMTSKQVNKLQNDESLLFVRYVNKALIT